MLFCNDYTYLGRVLFSTGIFIGPTCTIFGISFLLPSKHSVRIYWVIIGCLIGAGSIYLGTYFLVNSFFKIPQYAYSILPYLLYIIPYILLVGGTLLIIGAPLNFARNSKKIRKLDSLSQADLVNLFSCPKCGTIGAIYFVKPVKDQLLVKQKCPYHGGRLFKLPIRLKDDSISHFQDAIFRCLKCGQRATSFHVKYSLPWALITVDCPTHGLKTYKIWYTVYSEISEGIIER